MKIIIETIEHHRQRYNTVGDWTGRASGSLTIRVSETGDWRTECLIAFHELVEAILCEHSEVSDMDVDDFDLAWIPHHGLTEPGEDDEAPYHRQHFMAEGMERRLATYLDVDWTAYEQLIAAVGEEWPGGETDSEFESDIPF